MTLSPQLLTLARYLSGEFDNQEQALGEPAWYVHVRLWHRPVCLFTEDSFTLFAEQASVVNPDKPYRQRILRLTAGMAPDAPIKGQYYMPKNPSALLGAGRNPGILDTLTPDQLELLPSCVLNISQEILAPNSYKFAATPPTDTHCSFSYNSNTVQVSLGFEATQDKFMSYDKGIDPITGKATWGAILGPYRYIKRLQY